MKCYYGISDLNMIHDIMKKGIPADKDGNTYLTDNELLAAELSTISEPNARQCIVFEVELSERISCNIEKLNDRYRKATGGIVFRYPGTIPRNFLHIADIMLMGN